MTPHASGVPAMSSHASPFGNAEASKGGYAANSVVEPEAKAAEELTANEWP